MHPRIAGTHRPTGRLKPAHPFRAHLYVAAAGTAVAMPPPGDDDDAAYLNASPLARLIVRLLMRFF